MIRRQRRRERRPDVCGLAIAMQQDEGWAGAADAHVDRGAVHLHVPCMERRRKRRNLRYSWSREDQKPRVQQGRTRPSAWQAPLLGMPERRCTGRLTRASNNNISVLVRLPEASVLTMPR